MKKSGMDFLNDSLLYGMKPGLQNMETMCRYFNHPEKSFQVIHVVGTNGKGSSAYYLAQILKAHEKKAGLFSSPHLVSLQERIRVNQEAISKADLESTLLEVQKAAIDEKISPTFFEIMTMVCLLYFREQQIEVAVLEAGLGGRLDSTAIAKGKYCVLTSIGLDHTEILGDSLSSILNEKLGILSAGSLLIRFSLGSDLDAQASQLVKEKYASEMVVERDLSLVLLNGGTHFKENATLSLKAAELVLGKEWKNSVALEALSQNAWAGRMHLLKNKNEKLEFILDGAHNLHAMERLVETLNADFHGMTFPCVFGAVKDKDVSHMIRLLAPFVSKWYFTRTPYMRFRETEELAEILLQCGKTPERQFMLSKEDLLECQKEANGAPILVTGSLYLIGGVVDLLKNDFESLSFFRGLEATTNEHR